MLIIIERLALLERFECQKEVKELQFRLYEYVHWKKDLKIIERQNREETSSLQTHFYVLIYS